MPCTGEPRRSASHAVFTEFLAQQHHLLDMIDEARDIDLRSAPAGWVIGRAFGLSVGDALELLALRGAARVRMRGPGDRYVGVPEPDGVVRVSGGGHAQAG